MSSPQLSALVQQEFATPVQKPWNALGLFEAPGSIVTTSSRLKVVFGKATPSRSESRSRSSSSVKECESIPDAGAAPMLCQTAAGDCKYDCTVLTGASVRAIAAG